MRLIGDGYLLSELQSELDAAHHSIDLLAYNVGRADRHGHTPYSQLWQTLLALPTNGLRCRALLPNLADGHADNIAQHAALMLLHANGWQLRRAQAGRVQHAKAWIIDGMLALLTSANLSESALTRNIEHMVSVDDRAILNALNAQFRRLWFAATPYAPRL
jgi:phosphatidylserine/phosphatidylglycerophosphate/cardiolipin synthase-like enzyme